MAAGLRPVTTIGETTGLRRCRVDSHGLHAVERPPVGDLFGRPQPSQQRDGFIGAAAPFPEGDPAGLELLRVLATNPDPEDDPAAGDQVDVGHLLGDDRRRIEGEQQRRGADAHPAGQGGQPGQLHHHLSCARPVSDVAPHPQSLER